MTTWSKPSTSYVNVYVKGVFDKGSMRAVTGCVMRDENGEWVERVRRKH